MWLSICFLTASVIICGLFACLPRLLRGACVDVTDAEASLLTRALLIPCRFTKPATKYTVTYFM